MEFLRIKVNYLEEVCNKEPGLIGEMIDIFRDQVKEFSDEMKRLYEQKEYYDLGLLAHKAKSSIAIMGMEELAVKLKELELKAKEGVETETYSDYLDDFVVQTGEALEELDNYLNSL